MSLVEQLTGVRTREGVRLRAPMAPRPAAVLEGASLPSLDDHVAAVAALGSAHDVVVVEGAGGLLVELTERGETLADLVRAVPDGGTVLVARSGLGTLNHTMLTREALAHRGIRHLGIVIGAWPDEPDVIETTNREYLAALPEGLLGAVPLGAPQLGPVSFRSASAGWLPGLVERLGGRPDGRLGQRLGQRLGTP
jgi:dethiobiotin synthase